MDHARIVELGRSYVDLGGNELLDLVEILCDAIHMYDGGFGDMPGKDADLKAASVWLYNLIANDLAFQIEDGWKHGWEDGYREWYGLNWVELRGIASKLGVPDAAS